ncbi:hypothetical protein DPMN_172077 [Dreissena polymorpha]|uniref:Uncharacterized protein n=1 Tax=Dreissena polymorpha TaxID=45954 RepID=A0A9D4DZ58_DREPO|nr:hypothetical protein DPMN_172077 [Dreissena polymorpha]
MKEFGVNVSNQQESQESLRPQIVFIFQEIIDSYLYVLMGQFRKDVKTSRKFEKKMAHRKQVKVSENRTDRKQKRVNKTGTASIQEGKEMEGGSRLSELIDVGPSFQKKISTRSKNQNKKT